MPSISISSAAISYTPLKGSDAKSHLKSVVIPMDEGITQDHIRPLQRRLIEVTPKSFKSSLKVAVCSAMALVGVAGMYCVRRYFGNSHPVDADTLLKAEHNGLDPSHNMISTRAIPIALPLEDQMARPGLLFEVSHEFFTEAGDGLILQNITEGPYWLTSQRDPIVSAYVQKTSTINGAQVLGNTAYVADWLMGLRILNLSIPSAPTLIRTFNDTGGAYSVQVVGEIAYVCAGTSLKIINVTLPDHPFLIGTYDTPTSVLSAQIVNNLAYVTYFNAMVPDSRGLHIVDIKTPSSPTFIGFYDIPDQTSTIRVVGEVAYIGNYTGGLIIINVTSPSAPTLIGKIGISDTCGTPKGVEVTGMTAYVVCYNSLLILNMTSLSHPTLIATYNGFSYVRNVQCVGNILYMTGAGSLHIADITIPEKPIPIWTYPTNNGFGLQVVGTTAYVTTGSIFQIISGLNRLKVSGTPSYLDRSNYKVNLKGTTTTGTASISFNLNVGGQLAPVYQSPISMQIATVDKSFNYIMPDTVFVDPNGDAMTYKAKDLPKWLIFDAGKRTFSGTPTSGDTGTFADKSAIITVVANDGRLETGGQFMLTVTGESYFAKVIKIVGPILSVLGTLYSGYKNRALFLNPIAKRKWKHNQMHVRIQENFMYALKTNGKDVLKVQAFVKDEGCLGKVAKKIFCGKAQYVEFAQQLPMWMRYNTEVNTLYSIRTLEEIDLMGPRNIQVRMIGSGNVIKEILHLTLEGDVPTLEGTFDSLPRMEQERLGLLLFSPTMTNGIEMDGIGKS